MCWFQASKFSEGGGGGRVACEQALGRGEGRREDQKTIWQ